MNDCTVCGKIDAKKPMVFRGEKYCSEQHRKILAGEYGYDVGTLFATGLITHKEAAKLWGTDMKSNSQAKTAVSTSKRA